MINNQRFCVLPAGRHANVASAVLARELKRLSGDYLARWGHPVLSVETYVDPARHRGTCYQPAGSDDCELPAVAAGLFATLGGLPVRHGRPV